MGEEAKKPEEKKKKAEEEAKPLSGDEKKEAESKDPPPSPPLPQEVVLRVFMHCEGCARKVRRCLKGFEGVEDVVTDCKNHKVVVKGEKTDPLKVLERVQKKSNRKVELLSPAPKLPAPEEVKKPEEKEPTKPEAKKDEPPAVVTVVLKVHMHCEACAQVIRKRILRMEGVESVVPDLKNSQVAVKGIFPEAELIDYVYKRTGKHAVIVKQDHGNTEGDKKEEKKSNEKKEDKKADDGGDKQLEAALPDDMAAVLTEMRKNEHYYNYYYEPENYQVYPSRYAAEAAYAYPPAPQMFSDENPNACNVM